VAATGVALDNETVDDRRARGGGTELRDLRAAVDDERLTGARALRSG
jgi:hypothetical protein